LHSEAIGSYVFSNVMISVHDVPGMFRILLTVSHSHCTFTVKVDRRSS
jgi:hypothetical protein